MIREAELFVLAEGVLVEVLGRIRAEQWRIMMPPLFEAPGPKRAATLRQHVRQYVRDDAWVPELLGGATMDNRFDGDVLGGDPQAAVVKVAAAACDAARGVEDPDAVVHAESGDLPVAEYLWRCNLGRCFLAHEVAMHLGSRACPFTEELARGMWEGTWPDAARWRSLGFFREPLLPLPDDVSWRDRFLLCAGRDPHPWHH